MATPVLTNLVTRYTQPVVQNVGAPNDFKIEEVDLFVDPNGKWVKYEDFKVVYDSHSWLHDEVQRLEAEIKRLRGAAEPTSNLVCADCNGTGWFNEGEKVACEECVTGEQRYFEVNGHYPGCGVYEGTQRGPCSCNAQNRGADQK